MSRTFRRARPKFPRYSLSRGTYPRLDRHLRDGAHQYYSAGCQPGGSCDYCYNGRHFSTWRREPQLEAPVSHRFRPHANLSCAALLAHVKLTLAPNDDLGDPPGSFLE
jgi:hypothetical protein